MVFLTIQKQWEEIIWGFGVGFFAFIFLRCCLLGKSLNAQGHSLQKKAKTLPQATGGN